MKPINVQTDFSILFIKHMQLQVHSVKKIVTGTDVLGKEMLLASATLGEMIKEK